MNKYKMLQIAKDRYRRAPYHEKMRWKKKLKFLALFLVVGTLLFGGAAIWGTVVIVDKVYTSMNQGTLQETLTKGESQLKTVASQPITTKECLSVMSQMVSPTHLLTVPLAKQFEQLKTSCWRTENSALKES